MRRTLHLMPMLLLTAALPALAAQPEPPTSGASHTTQVFRSGKGEPRVRTAAASRTATQRPPSPAEGTGRTRPYQPAKPGEGAPKL